MSNKIAEGIRYGLRIVPEAKLLRQQGDEFAAQDAYWNGRFEVQRRPEEASMAAFELAAGPAETVATFQDLVCDLRNAFQRTNIR